MSERLLAVHTRALIPAMPRVVSSLLALLSISTACGGTETPKENPGPASETPAPANDTAPAPQTAREMPVPTTTLKLGESTQLTGESGPFAKLTDVTSEAIAESPADPESYPAGSGVTLALEMAGRTYTFSELSQGYESKMVDWSPEYRITLVDVDPGAGTANFQIERITETATKTLHSNVRIDLNGELALEDDVKAAFIHHGHKRTFEGQQSPLMVSMRYSHGGQEIATEMQSVFPPGAAWTWRNYRFELGEYSYGEFMHLTVHQLGFEAVTTKTP